MNTRPDMTTTEQARKFLFDLSFDNGRNAQADEREKPKPTYTQEQLDAACQDSYAQGKEDGKIAQAEDQQEHMNAVLSRIEQKIGEVIEQSQSEWQKQLAQLQEIALVIARKIMPTYINRHGAGEIETIVAKVIAEMGREPRLVFRVNEANFDSVSARINALAATAAYAGKLVILGDPDMGVSDCRIEWADGGIERDLKKLWHDIDRIMEDVQTFEDSEPAAVTASPAAPSPSPSPEAPATEPVSGEQT